MEIDEARLVIGVITGSVPPSGRAAVERISGAAVVEEERTFHISPPGADVQ
jgi:hypothetical protein